MAIEIIEDVIIRMGDGIIKSGSNADPNGNAPYTTYSFIRFAGGRVLEGVTVRHGLDGEISRAISEGKRCRFHRMGKWIVAIEEADGTVFASNLDDHARSLGAVCFAQVLIGTLLLPAFGAGLIVYLFAWNTYSQFKAVKQARKHIRQLPGAIVI